MKDLSKNVNYDLSKCSDDQLKQICDWLVKNDEYNDLHTNKIIKRRRSSVAYDFECETFLMGRLKGDVCATTLFETNDNLDTLIADTMRKFRVLGYEIDIVIKNKT